LFDATLKSDIVHAVQHTSFFGTALLFWWAVINGSRDRSSRLAGVFFLFLTSLHSGVLGAFLTFTRGVWYSAYLDTTASWGITPLEDQQLGGLIMWIPAGIVYILAGLIMFGKLLDAQDGPITTADQEVVPVESIAAGL
jgi:putative membrane protein